jgi:hypothetical protein
MHLPIETPVSYAVEGSVDAATVRKFLRELRLVVGTEYIKNGKAGLDASLAGYNNAARFTPWIVLRDLNGDAPCAGGLRADLLERESEYLFLRIPVRAIESWLMADGDAIAEFLHVSPARVPKTPDQEGHPKTSMVNLARNSRRKAIREAMVPRAGSGISVGPEYTAVLIEFAEQQWSPTRAAKSARSPSLSRSFARFQEVVQRRHWCRVVPQAPC